MNLQDNPIALIDGDILVYKSAFSSQKALKLVLQSGDIEDYVFYYSKFFGCSLIDKYISKINEDLCPCKLLIYLSPEDKQLNYRTHVKGAFKEYKGNRKPRPFYYAEMRKYLVDIYGAEILNQDEADDAIGMLLYQDYNENT